MGETNKRYDLGELKRDQSLFLDHDLFDMPEGDYRIYAERVPDKPLNERMAERFHILGPSGTERMQTIIDEFGLVERSKLPDPVDVPEWVQRWLDANVSIGSVSDLKAWIREAVIAGAVRVETPDVPEDVLADARWAASGVFSGKVCRLADWVLEQVGETDG